jgi:hypothetical protein
MMMWYGNEQIPTEIGRYEEMEQVFNTEIFYKVLLEKDKMMKRIVEEREDHKKA